MNDKFLSEDSKYRIEPMGPSPVPDTPGLRIDSGGWGLIRNHDNELMAIYETREEAGVALRGGGQ